MITSMMTAMLLAATAAPASEGEASLTVTVEGLAPQGAVMMALYADEPNWNGGDAVEGLSLIHI